MSDALNIHSRWQLVFGVVAFGGALIGALISFFVSTASLDLKVVALQAQLKSTEDRVRENSDRLSTLRADGLVMTAKLVEIETQFCASDIVRNLMHANDLRIESMLWQKSYPGITLPIDNAFYPQVCNRTSIAPSMSDH